MLIVCIRVLSRVFLLLVASVEYSWSFSGLSMWSLYDNYLCVNKPSDANITGQIFTSPHKVWKYCDECVCLSARISPEPHVRSLPNFLCMLSMAMARSSSGVIAISYVLPVLWPYSGMNFAMKDRFHLSLLIYRKFGQNTISYH